MTDLCKLDHLIYQFLQDSNYKINMKGRIFSLEENSSKSSKKKWVEIGFTGPDGYKIIMYKGKSLRIHRIVYARFHGPLDSNLVINHLDGNRSNNYYKNLELVTVAENNRHAIEVLGRAFSPSKLDFDTAESIREKRQKGSKIRDLALEYGISMTSITDLLGNRTWACAR